MSDAGSDIDDDQLNSLLFTDSDEDNSKKRKRPPVAAVRQCGDHAP